MPNPLGHRSPAALEMRQYSGRFRSGLSQADESLLAQLAGAELDGLPVSQKDFDAMFRLLIGAGNETTRSALALGIEALASHPVQWHRLRAGLDLDVAAEEILRWTTPLHHFRRTATRDTTLAGRRIQAGDKVVVVHLAQPR